MKALWLLLILPVLASGQASPWQQFELVGQARLNFMVWPVYDARLLSPHSDFRYPATRPFALEIEYRRSFSRDALVAETRRQWQAQGIDAPAAWLEQLAVILRDVERADIVTLYVSAEGHSAFYLNGSLLGEIADPAFSDHFSAIWLSEKTTRPDIRADLLRKS